MKDKVIEVIEKIRPYIQQDGGDLEFVDLDEEKGIVFVRMLGACASCVGIDQTLKFGIEALMIEEVEGITEVRLYEESLGF